MKFFVTAVASLCFITLTSGCGGGGGGSSKSSSSLSSSLSSLSSSLSVSSSTTSSLSSSSDSSIKSSSSSQTLESSSTAVSSTSSAGSSLSGIVGTWSSDNDVLQFRSDGTFIQIKHSNDDSACVNGSATGVYTWNAQTSTLTVTLATDSTMEVDDASCSLPGDSSLVLSGNTIVAQNTYTFEKVETINVRDTIVGQFAGVLTSSDIFIFEEGGAFTHTKTDNDDPKCSNGTAKGTYVWNPVTSLIDVSLTSDETTSGGTKPSCSIPGLHLITVVENGLFVDDRLFFHTME